MRCFVFFSGLFLLINSSVVGQVNGIKYRFEFQQTNEKTSAGIKSVMNSEVQIPTAYSASENYTKIYQLLAQKHEYPEDVIIDSVDPKRIVIQEIASQLFTIVSLGYRSSFDMQYQLTFEIKDQLVLLRISNLKQGNSLSTSGNIKWRATEGLFLHKRNGKPKKSMKGITDVRIENHFNDIVVSVQRM